MRGKKLFLLFFLATLIAASFSSVFFAGLSNSKALAAIGDPCVSSGIPLDQQVTTADPNYVAGLGLIPNCTGPKGNGAPINPAAASVCSDGTTPIADQSEIVTFAERANVIVAQKPNGIEIASYQSIRKQYCDYIKLTKATPIVYFFQRDPNQDAGAQWDEFKTNTYGVINRLNKEWVQLIACSVRLYRGSGGDYAHNAADSNVNGIPTKCDPDLVKLDDPALFNALKSLNQQLVVDVVDVYRRLQILQGGLPKPEFSDRIDSVDLDQTDFHRFILRPTNLQQILKTSVAGPDRDTVSYGADQNNGYPHYKEFLLDYGSFSSPFFTGSTLTKDIPKDIQDQIKAGFNGADTTTLATDSENGGDEPCGPPGSSWHGNSNLNPIYDICMLAVFGRDFNKFLLNTAGTLLSQTAQIPLGGIHNPANSIIDFAVSVAPSTTDQFTAPFQNLMVDPNSSLGKAARNGFDRVTQLLSGFMILIFILIALANILQIQVNNYQIKKILPGAIIGFIVAFNSFFLMRAVLEISTQLSGSFSSAMTKASSGGAGVFVNAIANVQSPKGNGSLVIHSIDNQDEKPDANLVFQQVILNIFVFGAALLLFALAFMLLLRPIVFTLAIPLAPLAFFGLFFPPLNFLWKRWWKLIVNWIFMPVVASFWLWLAFIYFTSVSDQRNGLGSSGFLGFIANYVVGVACFYAALRTPFTLAGEAKSLVEGMKNFGLKNTPAGSVARQVAAFRNRGAEANKNIYEGDVVKAKWARNIPGAQSLNNWNSRQKVKQEVRNNEQKELANKTMSVAKDQTDRGVRAIAAETMERTVIGRAINGAGRSMRTGIGTGVSRIPGVGGGLVAAGAGIGTAAGFLNRNRHRYLSHQGAMSRVESLKRTTGARDKKIQEAVNRRSLEDRQANSEFVEQTAAGKNDAKLNEGTLAHLEGLAQEQADIQRNMNTALRDQIELVHGHAENLKQFNAAEAEILKQNIELQRRGLGGMQTRIIENQATAKNLKEKADALIGLENQKVDKERRNALSTHTSAHTARAHIGDRGAQQAAIVDARASEENLKEEVAGETMSVESKIDLVRRARVAEQAAIVAAHADAKNLKEKAAAQGVQVEQNIELQRRNDGRATREIIKERAKAENLKDVVSGSETEITGKVNLKRRTDLAAQQLIIAAQARGKNSEDKAAAESEIIKQNVEIERQKDRLTRDEIIQANAKAGKLRDFAAAQAEQDKQKTESLRLGNTSATHTLAGDVVNRSRIINAQAEAENLKDIFTQNQAQATNEVQAVKYGDASAVLRREVTLARDSAEREGKNAAIAKASDELKYVQGSMTEEQTAFLGLVEKLRQGDSLNTKERDEIEEMSRTLIIDTADRSDFQAMLETDLEGKTTVNEANRTAFVNFDSVARLRTEKLAEDEIVNARLLNMAKTTAATETVNKARQDGELKMAKHETKREGARNDATILLNDATFMSAPGDDPIKLAKLYNSILQSHNNEEDKRAFREQFATPDALLEEDALQNFRTSYNATDIEDIRSGTKSIGDGIMNRMQNKIFNDIEATKAKGQSKGIAAGLLQTKFNKREYNIAIAMGLSNCLNNVDDEYLTSYTRSFLSDYSGVDWTNQARDENVAGIRTQIEGILNLDGLAANQDPIIKKLQEEIRAVPPPSVAKVPRKNPDGSDQKDADGNVMFETNADGTDREIVKQGKSLQQLLTEYSTLTERRDIEAWITEFRKNKVVVDANLNKEVSEPALSVNRTPAHT